MNPPRRKTLHLRNLKELWNYLHTYTIARYFWVAGAGFVFDLLTFTILNYLVGLSPMISNVASGTVGVTWVYFVSAKRIFQYRGRWLYPKFIAYVAYNVAAILLASALIAALAAWLVLPALLVKVVIVPVQFFMNYFILSAILRAFDGRSHPPAQI